MSNARERRVGFVVPWADVDKSTRFGVPIGVLYLCSCLQRHGWTPEVCCLTSEEDLHQIGVWEAFVARNWVFGISIAGYSRHAGQTVVSRIRQQKPDATILVGGPDITLRRAIPDFADYGMLGEGENRISALLEQLLSGEHPTVPGVAGTSGVFSDATVEDLLPTELDSFPYPARDLLGTGNRSRDRLLKSCTTLLSARGCAGRCAFCARPSISGHLYRPRSIESVVEELAYLQQRGYRTVAIVDDNFLFDRRRVQDIMERVLELGLRIELTLSGWANEHDEGLYLLLRKAGVRAISFGLESSTESVLRFYHKPLNVNSIVRALEACDKAGIFTVGNFIFGAPEETLEDMRHTLDVILSLPLDTVKIKVLGYTHGSSLWHMAHDKGLIGSDEFNVLAASERGLSPVRGDDIIAFCREATIRFHGRREHKERLERKIRRFGAPYSLALA